ncbi:hypothetical protein [Minwuia sp.]|uniref:hypothetical protein n=1 Tax=Minwuia sp. TaxID=2493630 RepID=UPI003A8F6464
MPLDLTRFDFKHRVFGLHGAVISLSTDRKAVLNIPLGDIDAAMTLEVVKKEFGITADTEDYQLLNAAEKALKFVKHIAPGDAIPTEIIDGTASWKIDDQHYDRARDKLMLRLASWATQQDLTEATAAALPRMMENPELKQHIQKGFSDAARLLQLDDSEQVVSMLEQMGREMAYIEALRSYYGWIAKLPKDMDLVQTTLKNDRQALEVALRARQIVAVPIREYRIIFEGVENQFTEVMSAFQDLPSVISYIRRARDVLHRDTLVWGEVEPVWKKTDLRAAEPSRVAINDMYRFLAQNFLKNEGW